MDSFLPLAEILFYAFEADPLGFWILGFCVLGVVLSLFFLFVQAVRRGV